MRNKIKHPKTYKIGKLVRKRIKHRWEGKTEKSQTPAGKISIGLQFGGASLETRILSLGYLRFFRLALSPVLDPLYLKKNSFKKIISNMYVYPVWKYILPYLKNICLSCENKSILDQVHLILKKVPVSIACRNMLGI